jgi:hypothetical protein
MRCAAPDEVADKAIISVDDPAIGGNREGHPPHEFIGVGAGQVAPARLPIDRVEFDARKRQEPGERLRQGRLSRTRCADDGDP